MATGGAGYRNPPQLDEKGEYETWKSEIALWQLVTDLKPQKQVPAVTLCLKGQAKERALELETEELHAEN